MGVYIKVMEMPTSCLKCDWCAHTIPADNYICYRLNRAVIGVAEEDVNETVNACCPLIPVPPHGDLIDKKTVSQNLADVLNKKNPPFSYPDWNDAIVAMLTAPTIIPAEEGEP